jgi:hypothetical protein
MLASLLLFQAGGAISMMVSFLVFIICVAIVIIGARWLLGLAGVTIPQPLLIILGLIFFLIFLLIFLNYTGIWAFGGPYHH